MRIKFIILLLIIFRGLFAQFDPYFDYEELNYWFDEEQFPPVIINEPVSKILLSKTYDISPELKYDFSQGVFFINKEGLIDTVIFGYPYPNYEDFKSIVKKHISIRAFGIIDL